MPEISWFMTEEMDSSVRELALDALREGFRTSFEELIKTSGAAEVLAAMKPHMMHIYHHYFEGMKKAMNIEGDGLAALLPTFQGGQEFVVPSDKLEGEIFEHGGVGLVHQCPFQNSIPELCIYLSHFGTEAVCGLVNKDYECIFTHHLTAGDPYCRFVFKKKGENVSDLMNLGKSLAKMPELKISDDTLLALQLGGITMQWNGVTSAFVQMNGSEKTREILYPNARRVGEETGIRIKQIFPNAGQNAETLGQLVKAMSKVLNQKGAPNFVSEREFVMQISDCACQSFVPEFCGQIGSLIDGMVGVLNPDYEFRYDRMMTQGDRTCHWAIRKKAPAKVMDDPLKILKMRLANGQITKEEYLELKEILEG